LRSWIYENSFCAFGVAFRLRSTYGATSCSWKIRVFIAVADPKSIFCSDEDGENKSANEHNPNYPIKNRHSLAAAGLNSNWYWESQARVRASEHWLWNHSLRSMLPGRCWNGPLKWFLKFDFAVG
jgi:hypothetical protein